VATQHLEHNIMIGRPRKINEITISIGHPNVLLLTIPTSQAGLAPAVVILFDVHDLAVVESHHWSAGKAGRPVSHGGDDRDTIYLSRLLAGATPTDRTSTVNGDARDLRRENLRICTPDKKTLAKRAARDRVSSSGNR
jgi:hypothetical protein